MDPIHWELNLQRVRYLDDRGVITQQARSQSRKRVSNLAGVIKLYKGVNTE